MTARYVIVHTDEHGNIETLATVVYTDRVEADHRLAERRRTAGEHGWSNRYELFQLVPADPAPSPPAPWQIRAAATGGGSCTCGKPFYTHVCLSCSPDYQTPGPGCVNCRNSGMDQTPCRPTTGDGAA